MSNLVERLRNPSSGSPRWADTMDEAADRITALEALVTALQAIASLYNESGAEFKRQHPILNKRLDDAGGKENWAGVLSDFAAEALDQAE